MKLKLLAVLEELSLVVWLGTTYAISLLVLPKAFAVLPRPYSGEFVQAIFPPFFAVSGIGLVLFLVTRSAQGKPTNRQEKALRILVIIALGFWAANAFWIAPAVENLRRDLIANEQAFRQWHGLSMAANLGVMLCGLPAMILRALQKSPA